MCEGSQSCRWVTPTPADIIAAKGSHLLRAEDIIISEVKVDLTKGDRNPMDNVSFFDYPESTEKRKVPPHQISTMFPICNRVSSRPALQPVLAPLLPFFCTRHQTCASAKQHM